MGTVIARRVRLICGATVVVLFVLLVWTATGRNVLASVYLWYTDVITSATYIHVFSLDRLDPTCPQCL
jgi:hypothetical protein